MKKFFTLRRATLLLALTLPSLCWGFGPAPKNALIVIDAGGGGPDETAAAAGLSPELVTAGYTVTTNAGVPGSLAGYLQVWDIRYATALTPGDITTYVAYLAAGGSLFTMGENTGFLIRDNSITALVVAAGGGTLVIGTPIQTQTVNAPFTGPNVVTSVTYNGSAGSSTPANGAFITVDTNGVGTGLVFGPGTMTNATAGALAIVFDVNFLELDATTPAMQALSANIIGFLAAPTGGGGLPGTAAPSTILLVTMGLLGAAVFGLRQRNQKV